MVLAKPPFSSSSLPALWSQRLEKLVSGQSFGGWRESGVNPLCAGAEMARQDVGRGGQGEGELFITGG